MSNRSISGGRGSFYWDSSVKGNVSFTKCTNSYVFFQIKNQHEFTVDSLLFVGQILLLY